MLPRPIRAQAGSSITVLPLGDSLTWGYSLSPNTAGGYRDPLYTYLIDEKVNVTYTGVGNGNPSATLSAAGETANDGFNGYTISQIDENLTGDVQPAGGTPNLGGNWLSPANGPAPNIILLMAGTNDITLNNPNLSVDAAASLIDGSLTGPNGPTGLMGLIADAHNADPNATILVASPPQVILFSRWTAIAQQLNLDMEASIPTDFAGENIHYVDMFDKLNQYGDFKTPDGSGDGIHLTQLGYTTMAQTWNSAILADYDFNADPANVPEPSTWALLLGGVLALLGWRKLRLRKS